MSALSEAWTLLKDTILSFIDDEALSRGAAIGISNGVTLSSMLLLRQSYSPSGNPSLAGI